MFCSVIVGAGTGISYSVVMGTLLQIFGQEASSVINASIAFIYGLGGMLCSVLYYVHLVDTPSLLLFLFILHACGIVITGFFTTFALKCIDEVVESTPINNETSPLLDKKETFGELFKQLASGFDSWLVLLILMLTLPVGTSFASSLGNLVESIDGNDTRVGEMNLIYTGMQTGGRLGVTVISIICQVIPADNSVSLIITAF